MPGHEDGPLNVAIVSCATIQHVLIRADTKPVDDLVAELEDIDPEDLCVAREELFTSACTRFNQQIADAGIKEQPHLEMKKRQLTRGNKKDKGIKAICTDIVILFHYCCELNDVFPKDTIAATAIGRYVNLMKEVKKPEDALVPTECNGVSHIMIMGHIGELRKIIDSQGELIASQSEDIKRLTERIVTLEKKKCSKNPVGLPAKPRGSDAGSVDGLQFFYAEGGEVPIKPPPAASSKPQKGAGEDKEVQIILPDEAVKKQDDDDQNWEDESVHEETESSKDGSFAGIAERQGPWQQDKKTLKKAQKKLKITLKGDERRVVKDPHSPKLISGLKREQSTMMYVRNIEVNERSDDEICRDMKLFGKSIGLRIMFTGIVRNRYCEDVVGCKIRIPTTQVDEATDISTWPDDVECRKWERKTQKGYGESYYKS